jgi:hypothetical protein
MTESIDDWPTRYRALSLETEKKDDYFKASLLKALNSQSLCATIYENDTITLSLLSSFDITSLQAFRSIHLHGLNRAIQEIKSSITSARLDTLTLSGAFGAIKNLLALSVEASQKLILPPLPLLPSSSLSHFKSVRIGLPHWALDENIQTEDQKLWTWSLQGLPKRQSAHYSLPTDPIINNDAIFNSFRHYGRDFLTPLFGINNPVLPKKKTTIQEDAIMRAKLINANEKMTITRVVSHDRILKTFEMLVGDQIKSTQPSSLSTANGSKSVSTNAASELASSSVVMKLAQTLLSNPNDLNVSALYDTIVLSELETLSSDFLGVEQHLEECTISQEEFRINIKEMTEIDRRVAIKRNRMLEHYNEVQCATGVTDPYMGANVMTQSAMKTERRFWESILFRNDDRKGAEIEIQLSMVPLGFEWFNDKDDKDAMAYPLLCQYPSIQGRANDLGGCLRSLLAHSEPMSDDPSGFEGALSFVFQAMNENESTTEPQPCPILKAAMNYRTISSAGDYASLSFASDWGRQPEKMNVTSASLRPTTPKFALACIRRLLRLSVILAAYMDQLQEEAEFISKLRKNINPAFDLNSVLEVIKTNFANRDEKRPQNKVWDLHRNELNVSLEKLKISSLPTPLSRLEKTEKEHLILTLFGLFCEKNSSILTRSEKDFKDKAAFSLTSARGRDRTYSFASLTSGKLNQCLLETLWGLLFGSQTTIYTSLGCLITTGALQLCMNQEQEFNAVIIGKDFAENNHHTFQGIEIFSSFAASLALSPRHSRNDFTNGFQKEGVDYMKKWGNSFWCSVKPESKLQPLNIQPYMISIWMPQITVSPTGGSPSGLKSKPQIPLTSAELVRQFLLETKTKK